MIFLMVLIKSSLACNPLCDPTWKNNTICNMECMNEACDFDGGDCYWQCSHSGCSKNASDGVCDSECDLNVCGFDFGDCGYCRRGCNSTLYNNSVCDPECNFYDCNYDNNKCGVCSTNCTSVLLNNGNSGGSGSDRCDYQCAWFECVWDNYKCWSFDCDSGCTDPRKIGDGKCDKGCNTTRCSYDGGDCDCSPGCSPNMFGNGVCNTYCNNSKCAYDYGECYCSPGCSPAMLTNGLCDQLCNNQLCYFDMGDCLCPSGCTDEMRNDTKCDTICNISACDYDNGSCNCAPGCYPEYIGNGSCQLECKNSNCSYDDGDCDCNFGCSPTMQGDGTCQSACNTTNCSYDNADCYCSSGCAPAMIHDGHCDTNCNKFECYYDGGDCNCASGCFPDMIGNGKCDPFCFNSNCSLDAPDCDCAPGCTSTKLDNTVCDPECNNFNCSLDNHKCGDCASGCFNNLISNGICEPSCKVAECDFDYNDCADIFYYWPNDCKFALNDYTNIQSTDCDLYFYFAKDSYNAKVYMVGGNYTFNNPSYPNMLAHLKTKILIIQPGYCANAPAAGCYDTGVKPEFKMAIPMYFDISINFQISNFMFTSFQTINATCSEYSYCRYIEQQGYRFTEDREQEIQNFVDLKICDVSSSINFFNVHGDSKLVLSNILFADMRFKYNSIINMDQGNVILTNVDFYNIVTQNKSSVIQTSSLSCTNKEFKVLFSYTGGKIQFINNGYEVISKNPLAGFLDICNIQNVVLKDLVFTMNVFSGVNSHLIKITDFFQLEFFNLYIEFTYSNSEIVLLDQRTISSIVNTNPDYLNVIHLNFSENNFINNVGSSLILILYDTECHNVLFFKNLFDSNEAMNALIDYKLSVLSAKCLEDSSIKNYLNISSSLTKRSMEIIETKFTLNYAKNMISLQNAGKTKLASLEFESNMDKTIECGSTIVSIMEKNSGYMENTGVSVAEKCFQLIYVSNGYNITFYNSTLTKNFCSLAYFNATHTTFEFTSSLITENKVTSSDHLIYLQVEYDGVDTIINGDSDFKFYDLKFLGNALGTVHKGILYFPKLSFNKLVLRDIEFNASDSAIYADQVKDLMIENIIFNNSISLQVAGLSYTPSEGAKIEIVSSFFERCITRLIQITGTVLTQTSIIIKDSEFTKNSGYYLIYIDNRIKFINDSEVILNVFEENYGDIFKISSSGPLPIHFNSFLNNSNPSKVSILDADGDLFLSLISNDFTLNKGSSLLSLTSLKNSSHITSESNTFSSNSGTSIKIYNIYMTDLNSSFTKNSHTDGTAIYSSTKSVVILNSSNFISNSADLNGIITNLLDSEIYLFGIKLEGNSVGGKGGVLFNDQNSTFVINGSNFEGNKAYQGSCVYSHYSYTNNIISQSQFRFNEAKSNGAISLLESYLKITSSLFYSNKGGEYSGIELSYFSKVFIDNSRFDNELGNGGSLMAESKSIAKIFKSSFSHFETMNSYSFFGIFSSELVSDECSYNDGKSLKFSSFFCDNSVCSFTRSQFMDFNHSDEGSVFEVESSSLTMFKCSISNSIGSAIFLSRKAAMSLSYTKIQDSYAYNGAGIKCVDCKSFTVTYSNFSNLNGTASGGGIFLSTTKENPICTLQNTFFQSCSSKTGGAIFSYNTNLTISQSTFSFNSATSGPDSYLGQGGCIFISSTSQNSFTVINSSTFSNNSANISGGAIQWYSKKPSLNLVKYFNNSAYYGENIASFPEHISLSLARRRLAMFQFAPGQLMETPIIINSLDHYNQVVLTDELTSTQMYVNDTKNFSITTSTKQFAVTGIYNFSEILIKGPPKTNVTLIFISDFALAGNLVSSRIEVPVKLRECLKGETMVGNDTCSDCPKGKYNLSPRAPCKKCPTGAICYGGSNIVSASGYWRTDNESDIFFECPNPSACLEEQLGKFDEKCADGYSGKLCQSCMQGYSRSKENECSACMDEDKNIIVLTFLSFIALIIVIGLTASNINGAYKEQSITSIYFKILTNHTQIIALTISFNLEWPDRVLDMFKIQSQGAGGADRLFSLDCFLSDKMEPFYAKLIMLNVVPVAFAVLTIIFWSFRALIKTCENVKSKIIGSVIVQLFFFQPSIMKLNFSMFSCLKISQGEFYMTGDMSIQCWKNDHLFYGLVVALPGIIIWCLLIPIVLALILYKRKSKLNQIQKKLKYGFLYKGFKSDQFYWEFFTLFRKIGMISCSVFLRNVSVHLQALSVFLIILITLIVQIKVRPYTHSQLNSMDAWSMIVSAVTIYAGLYFMTGQLQENFKLMLFIFMVIFNFVFAVYWTYYTFGFYIIKCLIKIKYCKKILMSGERRWVNKIVPDLGANPERGSPNEDEKMSKNSFSSTNNITTPTIGENVTADITMDTPPKVFDKPRKLKLQWVKKNENN